MKTKFIWAAALLACLPFSGLQASPAPVTDTASDAGSDSDTLPQVVVTARRAAEPADATGSSVSVVTRQQIEERQYQTVADALSQLPGLYVAVPGTPGQAAFFVSRGLITRQNLILVNGRPLPVDTAGAYDLTNLALDNVERIEVVRGPLSAVQGNGAGGSTVNIITRDGRDTVKPEYTASFEAGSYNTFHEVVTARGMQGPFDYSASASFLDTSNQRANNDYRRGNADAALGYQAAPGLRLRLDTGYRSSYTGNPGPTYGVPSSDPNDPSTWLLSEVWRITPSLEWKTTEAWTQTLSYERSEQRQSYHASPQAVANAFYNSYRSQINANQLNYDSTVAVADNLKVTTGLEGRTQDVWYTGDDLFLAGGGSNYDNNQTNAGAGLGLDYEPVRDWKIDPNVRIERYSDYGVFTDWRVASSYRTPGTRTRLHASYGTSTTSPYEAVNISYFVGQAVNAHIKPELNQGFDAGVEQPFFGGKWTLDATYFQNDLKDLIVFAPVTFAPSNLQSARTQGVELSSAWHPVAALDLAAAYTYLDAEDLSGGGSHLPVRPRNTATLSVTGRPCKGVALTAEGGWVNGVSASDPATFAYAPVGDYYTSRLAASWQATPHLELFARMENALNEKTQAQPGFPAPDQALYGGFKLSY